ncbi:MAG: hypothetical protein LBG96_17950, partial [Tannerella sp.]|nr:hypothetical protein [Tannerella sp.]
MKKTSFILLLCLLSIAGNAQKNIYDVAAFVWPSYHPDERAKIFWPEGMGEWQTVKSNKAKFP